ncbi:MAG: sensor histidine kinase [Gammaproteobacteria bacterium]|nr:sensor histidine kinase [Gammaproteobacteria bacterium]
MKTYFAPAERLDAESLQKDIEWIGSNPIIEGLLNFASGVLAVLNEQRQIVALNTTFLKFLGIHDPADVLGLRPGEAVNCVHAHEMEGGCGTSEYCSSCGAAISIVSSLKSKEPVERMCALTIEKDNVKRELLFKVRSLPIVIDERTFLMLFLSDITGEQQAAIMERVFFHDINNIVFSILGSSQLLCKDPEYNNELIREIYTSSVHLAREIAIQQSLFQEGVHVYRPLYQDVHIRDIVEAVRNLFVGHPVAKGRELILPAISQDIRITTDQALVVRILVNMIKNALEASEENGQVSLSVEQISRSVSFVVWNKGLIPKNIQKRIFQRNFSTREETGRGLGAYSMKYFGEQILGGCVNFSSSERDGTRFWLTLDLATK